MRSILDVIKALIGNVVYAFNVCRTFIRTKTETLSQRGQSFVSSAQTDLSNLKDELTDLWNFKDEQKKSVVIFLANIFTKALYTPCIVLLTSLAALAKLSLGFVCMTLGGDFFSFIKTFAVIIRDAVVEGCKIFGKYITDAWNTISEAIVSTAKKIGTELAKLAASLMRGIDWVITKIATAFDFLAKIVNHITDAITYVAKQIGKALEAVYRNVILALTNVVRFIDRALRNIAHAAVNLLQGVAHLAIGVVKAAHIIVKGVALSIAALFFETGIATAVSGVAKSIFIIEESLASAGDALIDATYKFGKSIVKATTGMVAAPKSQTTVLEAELDDTDAPQLKDESVYADLNAAEPTHVLRNTMHAVNAGVADAGNSMLNIYRVEKYNFMRDSEAALLQPEMPRRRMHTTNMHIV